MPKTTSSNESVNKPVKSSSNSNNNSAEVQALVEIVARLREPGGCPWDQEQTHLSLARYTIEEAFEMVEALEEREALRSELPNPELGLGADSVAGLDANSNSFAGPGNVAGVPALDSDSAMPADGDHAVRARKQKTTLAKSGEPAERHLAADQKFKDELGDLLFQVLLHSRLAEETGAFDFYDVIRNLSRKLIRRHPHVFSDTTVNGIEDVFKNWEEIKKAEKASRGETAPLISVPAKLPALQRAFAIGQKTRKLKFDWQNPSEVWLKVKEEIEELQEAMDNDVESEISHEIGDVLFSVAQLARHYDLEPEQVLRTANTRFLGRFEKMVAAFASSGGDADVRSEDVLELFGALSVEEKERFWEIAKRR